MVEASYWMVQDGTEFVMRRNRGILIPFKETFVLINNKKSNFEGYNIKLLYDSSQIL